MERYVCIHSHFYQPPRDNPWLEAIELQDSAHPYHDWNERIAAECYAANASSRILTGDGRVARILNNYSRISFNFGPTLLSWLEEKDPETYRAILAGDRESRASFSGHGSALAQAYNHMILPLANARDKRTQIVWGIKDFAFRFGRPPEGLWLPETAVDMEILEILAREGIRFTILAPHQAARVRKAGSREWQDVSGARIDPTIPYELRFRSGRRIALFFYDGPISQAVAFEGLLNDGEALANRILGAFSERRPWPRQLVHIATDGETYGHHHRYGEMALSYALRRLPESAGVRITNYGEHLERHPPDHEVQIVENSSWSCVHGIERWRSHCGCNTGGRPGWNQEWRAPLREALDGLRDAVAGPFEKEGRRIFKNPWAARDDYVSVLLDREDGSLAGFFGRHAAAKLSPEKTARALKLMEIQRHAMLMYTSCGWFFDEISGIETVQVLQYAGRAMQLYREVFGESLEDDFLERLARARSNLPEHGDGRAVFRKFVGPAVVDLHKVGAHYAVSSLFEPYGDRVRIFCYDVEREDHHLLSAGKTKLALGRATITSRVTRDSTRVTFGVLHLGDHNVSGGIRDFRGGDAYGALVREISDIFLTADLPELIRAVDRNFGLGTYSLKFLFRDEQRKILSLIMDQTLSDAEAAHRKIYEQNAHLLRFLSDMGHPLPRSLQSAAEVALNARLRRLFAEEDPDAATIGGLLEEAARSGVRLDGAELGFAFRKRVERIAERLREDPVDLARLQRLDAAVEMGRGLPFDVDFRRVQDIFSGLTTDVFPGAEEKARHGDEGARLLVAHFRTLGGKLSVLLPEEVP